MRDVERLFALRNKAVLRMQRTVVVRPVQPHLAQKFKGRVLIRRHHHFGEHRRPFAHGYLQSRHRSGFDIKPLGEVPDGREDQLRLAGHINPQDIVAVLIGGGTYLRSPEMDVDVGYGLARRLIDDLADDDGFHCVEN